MTQQELNDKLFEAVENDDLDQVKELISNGADVNAKEENGFTPLYYAKEKLKTKNLSDEEKEEIQSLIDYLISVGAEE